MFPYNQGSMMGGYGGMQNGGQMPLNGGLGNPAAQVRQEQIDSAVTFLQHPKVAQSSPAERVSFLEKKGLSVAEIGEALRRVAPNAPETALVSQAAQSGGSASSAVATLTAKPADSGTGLDHHQNNNNNNNNASAAPQQQHPFPTTLNAVARFPTPSFSFPQYRPPQGMMSISPGIYAYLPGSPPPKPATPLSAVVFRSLLALGSVAATGLALKKYIWPDVKLAWEAYNSTGDQAASPATISEQGVENAGVTPAQETKASDSKFAKRAPYGRPPSQPGSEVGKRSVYGDVSGLDKVNALAAETKDELFSKGVAEMKHELSSLSDQLKQQSVDFNRALDTIQDTLEALKNSSAGGQQTGSSNSNNGSNGSRTGGGPSQLDDTKQSINQGDGGLKQPLTPAQRLAKGQAAFQTAYATMQSNHTAKEVKQAVTTMILYITNIFKNEHQERFRRIVRSNNLFKTRVASVEGAQTFLEACGFFVNKNHLEWIKPDDNDLELLQWSVPLLQSGLKFLEDTANVAVEVAQPQTQPQSQPQTQPQSQPQTQPQSQPQQVTPWTPTQAQKGSGKGGHDRTVGYPAVSPISSMNNTSVNGHLAADISNTVSSPFSPVTQRPQTQSGMSWVQESDTEEREDTRPNAAAQSVLSQNTTTPATVQVVDDSDEDPTNGLDDLLANVGGDDDSFN